ncbi:MAG: putative baseplate assembly protein, partial [Gammaproteobacteria bacterium]
MKEKPVPLLDSRDAMQVYMELLRRRLGYVPEWELSEPGAGSALGRTVARYVQAIIQRLNQAPEKNRLAFYDILGLDLTPAQAARAPVVFQLSEQAADSRAPATAQLAAPPPPEQRDRVVFETERAIGIAAAKLTDVFSLWPGRDQYLDHSAAFLAGQAFQLFRKPLLQDTPHEIYLAHDTLFALAGKSTVEVEFELTQPSDEPLSFLWQYWDGKVWRGFRSVRPACSEQDAEHADSTKGLTRSGRFLLETDCAETAKTTVHDFEAFWIRGHLNEPLLPEPAKALPRVEGVRLSTLINQALKATLT